MLVYDPDGKEHDKDPVDARECVKHCGYSYERPVFSAEESGGKGKKPAAAVEQNQDTNS